MMLLIFLLGLNGPVQILEVPDHAASPRVHFGDLDSDGRGDIWMTDRDISLWVWDGASSNRSFKKIPFEPIGLNVKPARVGDNWRAHAYERGRVYEYIPESGWTVLVDLTEDARIRPGLEPLNAAEGVLIPTFDGYHLVDGPCILQRFDAMPAAVLNERRLVLRYPKPTWRDIDGDGRRDLIASPVKFGQKGELGIWSAFLGESGWTSRWSRVQFPTELDPQRHQFGDLNGDGFDELTVLAMPEKDMSLFEELTLMVYMGTGHGEWEPVAVQQLKTKQNLWQTGPIEMNRKGIFLYYYKGLLRSHFKVDRYLWDESGFVKPKPISVRWTVKDGERDLIILHDLEGTGRKDLILSGKDGFWVYERDPNGELPFDEGRGRPLIKREVTFTTDSGEEKVRLRQRVRMNYLRRAGEVALVTGEGAAGIWTMFQNDQGKWYVARL
ncbi:MAG: VCBS repeat-containing protein [Acidobacteriota bacterium]|nr:VCBS repeat-containing protein [Acidobacteriota bacterium]